MTTKIDDFFTRQRANEGIVLPLALPDGTPTEHTITIFGVDSDSFRKAESELKHQAMDLMGSTDKAAKEDLALHGRARLVASMVKGWSFDLPCTRDNVIRLLEEAPQIMDAIDSLASNRRRFFAPSSSVSSTTPEPSSASPSP